MRQSIGSVVQKMRVSLFVMMLLPVFMKAYAATTVTLDDNNNVTVSQPNRAATHTETQTFIPQPAPVVIDREAITESFQGRIVEVSYSKNQITIQDLSGMDRQVYVRPEMINNHRVGDYVQIRPATDLTIITLEENPKYFEGEIIRVDTLKGQIVVEDTSGRERRVHLKEGMIGTYKVDDYVRVQLKDDFKEAKMVETVRNVGRFEGNVVRVDPQASQIVVRDSRGHERTLLVRQGTIANYRVGNQVRVYQLADREDIQLARIIR